MLLGLGQTVLNSIGLRPKFDPKLSIGLCPNVKYLTRSDKGKMPAKTNSMAILLACAFWTTASFILKQEHKGFVFNTSK